MGGAGGDLDVVRLDGGVEGWRERRLCLLEAIGGLEVDRAALGEGELGVHLRRAQREKRGRSRTEGQSRARRALGVRAWDATLVVASATRRTHARRAKSHPRRDEEAPAGGREGGEVRERRARGR